MAGLTRPAPNSITSARASGVRYSAAKMSYGTDHQENFVGTWRLGFGDWDLTDLAVEIGSLRLRNPLIAASGCFGYGVEYTDAVDLSTLGGVAVKGLFLKERE